MNICSLRGLNQILGRGNSIQEGTCNMVTTYHVAMYLGFGLNGHVSMWPHSAETLMAQGDQYDEGGNCPEFKEFEDFVEKTLITVVAVHRKTTTTYFCHHLGVSNCNILMVKLGWTHL